MHTNSTVQSASLGMTMKLTPYVRTTLWGQGLVTNDQKEQERGGQTSTMLPIEHKVLVTCYVTDSWKRLETEFEDERRGKINEGSTKMKYGQHISIGVIMTVTIVRNHCLLLRCRYPLLTLPARDTLLHIYTSGADDRCSSNWDPPRRTMRT